MITIDEFKKCEMIVARIKEVKIHSNADKLYLIKVDTGNGEKQLVAGIRSSYAEEDLIGKLVIVANNLEPAVIRGEKSEGMILAVSDDKGITVIKPDRDIPLGSVVR